MPNLIDINEFHNGTRNPSYYFHDAVYQNNRNGEWYWKFTINSEYPYILYVHVTEYAYNRGSENKFLIRLRKFITTRALGDAIVSFKNKDYKWCWNADSAKFSWDKNYSTITNKYWIINFEHQEDAVAWKLIENDLPIVEEMVDELPDYPKDTSGYG